MENASKALIIAGAILLSIAIIGLGMGIFDKASNMMNDPGMDEAQIKAFNSKFENFVGPNIKGSDVKSLFDTIRAHNNAYVEDVSKQVRITNGDATGNTDINTDNLMDGNTYAQDKANIQPGRRYTVTIEYNSMGLVCEVGYEIN